MDDQPVCEETGQSETQLRRIDGQTIRIVRLKLFDYSHENLEKVCRVNKIYFNETTTKRNFRKALEDLLEGDTLEGWERHRAEHLLGEVKKETEINEKVRKDHLL